MDHSEAHRAILKQVDVYGLTTAAATARVATEGDRPAATRLLEELVRNKELYRHGSTYTPNADAPKPRDRWRDIAILSYCCLGNHERPRIAKDSLAAALASITSRLGVRPPTDKACIFDRTGNLARLWVEPYATEDDGLALGSVLEALQRATRDSSFALWSYLALSGEFSLLVLCRSRPRAEELARWLDRVPLVGRAGPEQVEIPVSTAVIQ